MSGEDLDVRLRRLFAGIDTTPGFEARLRARVASLPAVEVEALRLDCERRRLEARERLRREALFNAGTAVGVGAAAIAVIWREGPAITQWMAGILAMTGGPGLLAGVSVLAVGSGLWAAFGRLAGRL